MEKPLGVYLHIPFCSFLCHYCDFAKTARWDKAQVTAYFDRLRAHLEVWLEHLIPKHFTQIYSVNFGGGTPSLFVEEYADVLAVLKPHCAPGLEISLEANPRDISLERLQGWKALGFNRISIGVQTFAEHGLAFLKRDHHSQDARESLRLALGVIDNVNADLIYSWPGQSENDWRQDLKEVVDLGIPHLSLYNLTYVEKTPIGRAHARGKIKEHEDSLQESFYQIAGGFLAEKKYQHDEISNWSKPGFTCKHNWLYWQGDAYLGVGSGAHGFLPDTKSDIGLRYAYGSSLQGFNKLPNLQGNPLSFSRKEALVYGLIFEQRQNESWLIEYIGNGLRCNRGIDLDLIRKTVDMEFAPHSSFLVAEALRNGILLHKTNRLFLSSSEWFRETAWSLAVIECFKSNTPAR